MSWKKIDPERREALIEMLSTDARVFFATAEGMRKPSGREYFECMGRTYAAAAQALRELVEGDQGESLAPQI